MCCWYGIILPSTSGAVVVTVVVFFASFDGAKNVACVDLQINVLFPPSTPVKPNLSQVFVSTFK